MRASPQRYSPNAAPEDANDLTRSFLNDELRRLSTMLAQLDEVFITQAELDDALADYVTDAELALELANYALVHSPDNVKTFYGTGDDLSIYHDGTDSYVKNATGALHVGGAGASVVIDAESKNVGTFFRSSSGSALSLVSDATGTPTDRGYFGAIGANAAIVPGSLIGDLYLRSQAGAILFSTDAGSTTQFKIAGAGGHVQIPRDSIELQLGASQDLKIYHNGTNSLIHNTTGNLNIQLGSNTIMSFAHNLRVDGPLGTTYGCVWNYDGTSDENSYIRAGKATGTVLIGDVNNAVQIGQSGKLTTISGILSTTGGPIKTLASPTGGLLHIGDSQSSTENLLSIGTMNSSGGSMYGYGVKPKGSGGLAWVSSYGSALGRSVFLADNAAAAIYVAASGTVAVGSDVTMSERLRVNTTGFAFNGQTPVARPDYTISGSFGADRGVNGAGTSETLATLSAALATVINDLIAYGIFQ